MRERTGHATRIGRRFSTKAAGLVAIVLLLLLATAAYFLVKAYRESQEIREYVGGPYGGQLLYLQACAADESAGAGGSDSLEAQLSSCRRSGYYVYDFNIRRSVVLTESDLAFFKEYDIFSFPDSVRGQVGESDTNPFNEIIPFEEFDGFDYDCQADDSDDGFSCKQAPALCERGAEAIQCNVFNPRTGREEMHVIERYAGLDLLAPQGFISGPDIFMMLKRRFFPILER